MVEKPYELTNCDVEQIHLLGRVQNFGFLVGISDDWIVTHQSENLHRFLPCAPKDVLGAPVTALLSPESVHAIRNRLQNFSAGLMPEVVPGIAVVGASRKFDVTVHVSGRDIVLEFEPGETERSTGAYISDVQQAITRISTLPDMPSVLDFAVRFTRILTGFDRVMAYRFLPDGSGEVVAEAVSAGMERFLNLRYPASDIPRQARALYLQNPIRVIRDSRDEGSPVRSVDGREQDPLDLSNSVLRSVASVHLEYLRNMGVSGSMSISLIVEGRLWGLIACHHREANVLPHSARNAFLLFGRMLSLVLENRQQREAEIEVANVVALADAISSGPATGRDLYQRIEPHAPAMMSALAAAGLAVVLDGRVHRFAEAPPASLVTAIVGRLNGLPPGKIFHTAELASFTPDLDLAAHGIAGLLSIPVSSEPGDYLLFFRLEERKEVTWAGDPQKAVSASEGSARLIPRKSFEAWQQLVDGQSEDWTAANLRAADRLRVALLEATLQLASTATQERIRAAERQELLIAELNHRVKNILGLVRSLIAQTLTAEKSAREFSHGLDSRIQALARAHEQIIRDDWAPASLRQMIAREAESYLDEHGDRLEVRGDDVLLVSSAFSNVALVIHELVTNSAKYGAFSSRRGKVSVDIARSPDGTLEIGWIESGGPAVSPPSRRGFGSSIIERAIPHELGGEAQVSYLAAGLEARFLIPARHVRTGTVKTAPRYAKVLKAKPFSGEVLLVEDNLIIAMDAEHALRTLGATDVHMTANVEDALSVLDRARIQFGLLDINLGSDRSFVVGRRMLELGIPFVFASGSNERKLVMP